MSLSFPLVKKRGVAAPLAAFAEPAGGGGSHESKMDIDDGGGGRDDDAGGGRPAADAGALAAAAADAAGAGEFPRAASLFASAIALDGSVASWHEMRAQCLMEMGFTFAAVKVGARAPRPPPPPLRAVHTLAFTRLCCAPQSAECAVVLAPSWADAALTLGRAQLNLGEVDAAHATLARAGAMEPDRGDIQADLQFAAEQVERRRCLLELGVDVPTRALVADDVLALACSAVGVEEAPPSPGGGGGGAQEDDL
jgi:hypothetical protein